MVSDKNPRQIAARILSQRLTSSEFTEVLLETALGAAHLSPVDRGLCHELVCGVVMPPTVVLTAPTNGANVGAPLTLTATASSPFGIATVDFYSGSLFLGSDAIAPYTFTQNQLLPGSHAFTAVARDNSSLGTTSAPVTVNVVGSAPAAPQITGPTLASGKPQLQINGPTGYFYFMDIATNLLNPIAWTTVFSTNSRCVRRDESMPRPTLKRWPTATDGMTPRPTNSLLT